MMDECKGYACPPSTTVDLPQCEHGWELGNGTAVCAAEPAPSAPLAATGADPAGLVLAGSAPVAAGLAALRRRRRV